MSEERLVPKLRFKGFDDEWVIKRLDEISEINPKTRELPENFVYINLDSVNNGILTKFNKINKIDAPSRAQRCLDLNDILFQTVRPYQMNNFFFELNDCDYVASTGYAQIKSQIFPRFLYYYLHYYKFVNDVLNRCTGSSYPVINSTDLKKIKIKIPSSFNEQKLIGDLFHKIDKKIELLENKYEYYQYFKKYLMQQIFTQKLRFNFNDAWKTVKIKDIFDERSEKGFLDLELLSVTLNDGVIKRSEIESKDNSNENKSNYKHVLPGDIVYNSMRMWQGASGVSPYEGIVSPAYTILIPKNVYSKYFGYYFKTNEMVYQFKKYSQGLTSDTWNLKYPLISEIKIKIPSIEEQKEITNVFEIMDEKIKILQNNIDELTTFKKGLLQQMFV